MFIEHLLYVRPYAQHFHLLYYSVFTIILLKKYIIIPIL